MRMVPRTVIVMLACAAILIGLFPDGFAHLIGIDTQTSYEYAFFSGFGGWLSSTLGLSAIIATLWSHLNCHVDTCARMGRFHVADGAYRVCRKHHDDITGHHGRLSVQSLREKHGHSRTFPDDGGRTTPDNPSDPEVPQA